MAEVRITIPDAQVSRVVHAVCASAGLPESPANAKKGVIEWIKATVRNVERSEAEQAALDAVSVGEDVGLS